MGCPPDDSDQQGGFWQPTAWQGSDAPAHFLGVQLSYYVQDEVTHWCRQNAICRTEFWPGWADICNLLIGPIGRMCSQYDNHEKGRCA